MRARRHPRRHDPTRNVSSSQARSLASSGSSGHRLRGMPGHLGRRARRRTPRAPGRRRRSPSAPVAAAHRSSSSFSSDGAALDGGRGLFSSWARPADSVPSAASFSRSRSIASVLRRRPMTVRSIDRVADGRVPSSSRISSRAMRMTRVGETARTEAIRGWASKIAISPTISPGPRTAIGTSVVRDLFTTCSSPDTITKSASPGSPSPARIVARGQLHRLAAVGDRQESSSESSANSGTRRSSARSASSAATRGHGHRVTAPR